MNKMRVSLHQIRYPGSCQRVKLCLTRISISLINNNMVKNIVFWILIIGGMLLLFNGINDTNQTSKSMDYSSFVSKLKDNSISSIDVDGRTIKGKTSSGEDFITYAPLLDGSLVNKLEDSKAKVKAQAPAKPNLLVAFLLNWLPMLLIFGFFISNTI